MGLFDFVDDIFSTVSDIVNPVTDLFGGDSAVSTIASAFLPSGGTLTPEGLLGTLGDFSGYLTDLGFVGNQALGPTQPVSYTPGYGSFANEPYANGGAVMPVMSTLPQVGAAAGAVVPLAGQFVRTFLAAIAGRLGVAKWTSSKVWALIRMVGLQAAATALGVSLTNLITFTMASKKRHRRINPANTKALRRSIRRLESFDKLASRVSSRLARTCRRAPRGGARRRVCGTCRKAACVC